MTEFLQLHAITCYPPANLNRDDLGRPKTALFGGRTRLRISSQSLKRAWRQSPVFETAVGEFKGWRTRSMAKEWVYDELKASLDDKKAMEWAKKVASIYGKHDDEDEGKTKQLAHLGPEERRAIGELVEAVKAGKAPEGEELEKLLLRQHQKAADIALFGRMLADKPAYNVEAAAQVAHAITVHAVTIEDDYFTAVDDLNRRQEDMGAGHVGETEFGAGVFYLYLCIDCDRLVKNLQGDAALAAKALRGLAEAALTVAPAGKQNSFASRACASFALAERGDRQPRALSAAFLAGCPDGDYVAAAVAALKSQLERFDQVYGQLARERASIDVATGKGSLAELLDFVAGAAR
jgi:CRISPR system Cascade subunit CasC